MKGYQKMKRTLMRGGALLALLPTGLPGTWAIRAHTRPRPRITAAQARRVALKKYPGARTDRKIALENEDGKWEYAVNVHQRTGKGVVTHEVMVGATSGKIESEEVTTPAEEAREKAAEPRAAHPRSHSAK
jgi:uncharacterized membrane protein YkoI